MCYTGLTYLSLMVGDHCQLYILSTKLWSSLPHRFTVNTKFGCFLSYQKVNFVTFFCKRHRKFAWKLNIFISNNLIFFVFKKPSSINCLLTISYEYIGLFSCLWSIYMFRNWFCAVNDVRFQLHGDYSRAPVRLGSRHWRELCSLIKLSYACGDGLYEGGFRKLAICFVKYRLSCLWEFCSHWKRKLICLLNSALDFYLFSCHLM